jgi:hypothetical protein
MNPRIFVVSACLIFAANLSAQDSSPAPVYKNGDVWVFKVEEKGGNYSSRALDGDYEVTHKGGKFIVRRPGGEKTETRQDVDSVRDMLYDPDDKNQYLQFPLSIGKKWNTDYEADTRQGNQNRRRSAETKVTVAEQITTPAGTFRTFKIERYETAPTKRSTERSTFTYYYSPEVGGIVKIAYGREGGFTRTIELIKYVPAAR